MLNNLCFINIRRRSLVVDCLHSQSSSVIATAIASLSTTTILIIIILINMKLFQTTEAGTCWDHRMNNGKCKQPITRNISKKDCCTSIGTNNGGYSDREMTDYEYFFTTAIGNGVLCTSCIESCETANCPIGKRCILRNGLPKCICSPTCKSSSSSSSGNHHHGWLNRNNNIVNNFQKLSNITNTMTNNNNNNSIINKNQLIGNRKHEKNNLNNQRHSSLSKSIILKINSVNLKNSNKKNYRLIQTTTNNNKSTKRRQSGHNHHRSLIINENKLNTSIETDMNKKFKKRKNHTTQMERLRLTFYGQTLLNPLITENKNNAVCGTDGRTYKTECQLKKRACRKNLDSLQIAYKGYCQTSCKHVNCMKGMHCLEDQNLMPHCVTCSMKCPPYDDKLRTNSRIANPSKLVCGVDGNTYRNLCEIKRAACMSGRSIPVAYRGPCKDENINCNHIKCKDRQICLNDLITQKPRCVSCSFKCQRKRNNKKQMQHGIDQIQLCGMNNVTYFSWCQMMKESCSTGYFIDVKHNGDCNTQQKLFE